MKNNYTKPTLQGTIHKFFYDGKEFELGIREDGKFYIRIEEFIFDENLEIIDMNILYIKEDDSYHELKELFFTFHSLVPHDIKVEGGYEDGTFNYPYKKLKDIFKD